MMLIKKGKIKTRVFTYVRCKTCDAVYAYINIGLKDYVSDIFKDEDIFEHTDVCPNCGKVLHTFELTEDNYREHSKAILCKEPSGKTRYLTDDEIFVYI